MLLVSGWISASVSEFHTVEVQPGEEVTLLCSNFSSLNSHILWFKLAKRSNISCISSMISSTANPSFCDGFPKGKFNMTSNSTALFLKIKQVDFSDTGLYFCGFHSFQGPIISSATYLNVKGKIFQSLVCFDWKETPASPLSAVVKTRKNKKNAIFNFLLFDLIICVVELFHEITELKDVIVGAVIIVLNIIIFGLLFKICKLQTGTLYYLYYKWHV